MLRLPSLANFEERGRRSLPMSVRLDLLEEEPLSPEILRSEVNLLILPFFALSRKELPHKDESVYRTTLQREGKTLEVLWKVSRSINYRYPGPFDRRVHKAIEETINGLRLPIENPIPFSIYGLCQRMGISTSGGKNYRKVKEALKTVVATTIESQGTFFSKGRRMWVHDIFHLYDRIIFKGERLPNGEIADTNYLYLGSWYLESINSRYVKPLDYEYYKQLKRHTTQRLYELLGVKFYRVFQQDGLSYLNYRYSTLCELLPVAPRAHFSLARQQLDPAHHELQETGFLSRVSWKKIEDERDWMIHYYPGRRAKVEVRRFKAIQLEAGEGEGGRHAVPARVSPVEAPEVQGFVKVMIEELGDEKSRRFYTRIAQMAASDSRLHQLVYRCLSEVKEEARTGQIRTSKGAVFTDKLKRYCREWEIDLGLKGF